MQAIKKFINSSSGKANTFIGGVASTISTPALLATKLGINVSRIKGFKIEGSDISAHISGSYTMRQDAFQASTELTYFDDKEGRVTGMLRHPFRQSTEVEYLFFKGLLYCEGSAFSNIFGGKLKTIYIPNCTNLGGSVLDNGVFGDINSGAKLYVHPSLATNNAGAPDGDLTYAIGRGAIVRYVSNFSAPSQITTLTSGTIYNTAIQLNFTPPSSTNAIDYYELYVNGVFKQNVNSGEYLFGLTPSTTYTFELIAVDIFYNKSVKSNVLSVSTNTIPFPFVSNLFASYRFENNANDYLGVHNATPTALTYASGKVGQGAVFNGTSSFAIIPDNNVFSFTDGTNDKPFSISMCLKFSATTDCEILDKLQNLTDGIEYQMMFKDSLINMYLYSGSTAGNSLRFSAPFAPTVGVWYFITFTHIGGVGKWYVNGSLVTTSKIITGTYVKMINTNSSLIIGKRGFASGGFFNGSIDELNFYNKALSLSEITEIKSIINSGNHIIL